MKNPFPISCVIALASLPATGFAQSLAVATPTPNPAKERAGILSRDAQEAADAHARKAERDPAVRAAAGKLREAMNALRVVMVEKDAAAGVVFAKFEAAATNPPGTKAPTFDQAELARLTAGFKTVRETPELYAYARAQHDYREALRQAMTAQ
jgi:hypothetical protein